MRLFAGIDDNRRQATRLDGSTFRTLLMLLYGAALRTSEALNLTMADVDLEAAVLTVQDAKFFKSRLVPVTARLADTLKAYAELCSARPLLGGMEATFLANRDGTKVRKHNVDYAFAKLLATADVARKDDGRRAPCLHSFRHTAAVHRLTSWYRDGADVQQLLPVLSTYLGHANLDGTSIYLSMTPELLHEASLCFDHYANGADHE